MKFTKFHSVLLITTILFCASCTSKETRLREFVEKDVVGKAEDYFIMNSIVDYVNGEANKTIMDRANMWYQNFNHDYSFVDQNIWGDLYTFSMATGYVKEKFDQRTIMWRNVVDQITHMKHSFPEVWFQGKFEGIPGDTNVYCFRQLKTHHYIPYSIEQIADLYYMPTKHKFHTITEEEYANICISLVGLGVEKYQYDVVDDIRTRKTNDTLWDVNLVYHSGKCINFKVIYQDNRFKTMETPWFSDVEYDQYLEY